ncbi:hypothetical protein [Dehalococcoides mccartyi]|uniref:hypothetical protein n=1 Tax=Dehalococcoides mccartyi TaxID=61435 RepID=UPI0003C8310E|nr:hypothetical protein [Dehalococcoides mccartyi]AHB14116.1 hypothetical protein GY50_1345 [Dehalococcoides mccartyi GY50]APH13024.1 hypothetical protein ASJ33_07580 [Dehalococcoides mccartyi]
MKDDEILAGFLTAYNCFLETERDLLSVNANERSLTHKLAEHIQQTFPEYNVDCEYNRRGYGNNSQKKVVQDDGIKKRVFPDIVVHKRKTDHSNLLVIEAKKHSNTDTEQDDFKLKRFTKTDGDYHYQLGLLLILNLNSIEESTATKYKDGEVVQPSSIPIRNLNGNS